MVRNQQMAGTRPCVVPTYLALCLSALAAFATSAVPLSAQVLNFRHYTSGELPASQVLALHQDARQYIWIGTYAGLSRYNGADFRTWDVSTGLATNAITSIAEGVDGRMHVTSSGGGVCTLGNRTVRCLRVSDGMPHDNTYDVLVDPDGQGLWVATERGMARVVGNRVETYDVEHGVPGGEVTRVVRDGSGSVWVGGASGLARWDGTRFVPTFPNELSGRVGALVDTRWGLMVGMGEHLYLVRDMAGVAAGKRELVRLQTPHLSLHASINDAATDAAGGVWIATQAGVLHYDGADFQRYTTANGLLYDQVIRVLVDREGNVWFGTERGLSRLTPGPFRHYAEAEGLPNPFVRAIAPDATGRMWLGTRDGVAVREGDQLRVVDPGTALRGRRVYSLAPLADGSMLIGTRGGGIVHHDGVRVRGTYRAAAGVPGDIVLAMLGDGADGVWVGTNRGLVHWRNGRVSPVTAAALEDVTVVSLALDTHGRLWVGTRSDGVIVYDGETVVHLAGEQGLTNQTIWAIARDHYGAMWIGSSGDGAFRVDPDDLTSVRRLTMTDGLVNDYVWQVQPDSNGSLWLYTSRGLDRVDPSGVIQHYGRSRGLIELEGGAGASWQDPAGELWFGTATGLVRYTPHLDVPASAAPPVYIEEITSGADTLPQHGDRLRARDGVVMVRFAAPTFLDAMGTHYRYRLLGAGAGWSDPTAERSIGYARLGPGNYEFQVYAIDNNGLESAAPATLRFVVVPRWWQTWWFRLFALALAVAVVSAIIVARARANRAERSRLEAIVAERTSELSTKNTALEREVCERQRAEDALRSSQERLVEVVEYSTNMFYSHDVDGVITYLSPQSRRLLGCDPDEARGRYSEFLSDNPVNDLGQAITQRAINTGEQQPPYELELRGADGVIRWVEVNEAPVTRDGRTIRMVGSLTDITESKRALAERERLHVQLRQAQKMEAIGRLAGGIAHDFNNLLTAIVGNTELVSAGLAPEHPLQQDLAEVRHAAQRAASLVGQLLAFSRQQLIRRRVLDLNDVITGSTRMLRRMIGTDIELSLDLASTAIRIEADQAQLDQVVMNLALNARDAMPDGGRLTVATDTVELDERQAQRYENGLPAGRYAALRVSDSGHGMDPDTIRRVFEPFFTTKEVGKGTGLGLATVYGIVTQNGGAVHIESAAGAGTTFHILLPRVDAATDDGAATAPDTPSQDVAEGEEYRDREEHRRHVVLVVEDEESVRRLVCRTLERHGYQVLDACDGSHAVQICSAYNGKIDLLLTDMVMPGLNGRQVAELIAGPQPDTRVLYMSGHTNEVLGSRFMLDATTQVLEKPFAPADLVLRVRDVLAQ